MQCLILAGGFGTRMEAVSHGLPKSLLPVLGKPFVDYQLAWLVGQGVTSVVMSLGFKAGMIRDYLGDGARWGLDIACVEDGDTALGTAGAIRNAADLGVLQDGFFILYGDSYLNAELGHIWRASDNGSRPVMTVYRNEGQWDTGNVLMEDDQLSLYQKDASPAIKATMHHIDYGLSVLSRDVICGIVAAGQVCDLADVYHQLSLEGKLIGFEVFERFYEIGSPQGMSDLEHHLAGNGDG